MPVVSVTRLHLRSWRFFPAFLVYALRSARQAERAAGFLDGTVGNDAERGFWTLTVWQDEQAMRSFRTSGPHLKAMPRLLKWCDEASIGRWTDDAARLPDAETAFARMKEIGRPSKVHFPSPRHLSGRTAGEAPPRFGRRLSRRIDS